MQPSGRGLAKIWSRMLINGSTLPLGKPPRSWEYPEAVLCGGIDGAGGDKRLNMTWPARGTERRRGPQISSKRPAYDLDLLCLMNRASPSANVHSCNPNWAVWEIYEDVAGRRWYRSMECNAAGR